MLGFFTELPPKPETRWSHLPRQAASAWFWRPLAHILNAAKIKKCWKYLLYRAASLDFDNLSHTFGLYIELALKLQSSEAAEYA